MTMSSCVAPSPPRDAFAGSSLLTLVIFTSPAPHKLAPATISLTRIVRYLCHRWSRSRGSSASSPPLTRQSAYGTDEHCCLGSLIVRPGWAKRASDASAPPALPRYRAAGGGRARDRQGVWRFRASLAAPAGEQDERQKSSSGGRKDLDLARCAAEIDRGLTRRRAGRAPSACRGAPLG